MQNFPGACPLTPLEARAFGTNNYSLFSITWGWNLCPGIVQVYKGSSVTLNWSYTPTSSLGFGVINFNADGIVTINADGSAHPIAAQFQERFNVSSTTEKASLFISPVTVGDDKAYGEFRCELIDSLSKTCDLGL